MTELSGRVYVLKDNVDTDQILTAEYMKLNPADPEEYQKLGSLAMCGLPKNFPQFTENGKTLYPIIIAGKNFGCGSSREHAPMALGASGVKAVIANSFARIFFRNCISTGQILPCECPQRICEEFKTGDEAQVNQETNTLKNTTTGKEYSLRPLGEVEKIIKAGGLFQYARKIGIIKTHNKNYV